jgi:hypothetical protein
LIRAIGIIGLTAMAWISNHGLKVANRTSCIKGFPLSPPLPAAEP